MDTARWIDLTDPEEGEDHREGSDARPRGLPSSWSSAPLRDVARTAVRNEQSHAAILEALQSLREAAGRGGTVVAGAFEARGGQGGDSGTAAPGPLLARASAFAQRLTTAQRLMAQSSLRGSPSSAAERIAAAFVRAVQAASAEAERYPGAVRAVSSRTLNEMRQLLDAGTREASAAAMEVERAAAAFRAQHSAQGDAARREAERTALALRDRVSGSEAVAQLRRDVDEAARLSGARSSGGSAGEPDPFSALPGHLDALRRAAAPEAIEREAECAALAFRGFVEALRGARASPRTVPQALLDQIASAERRREMAGMPADRARTLLEHTRRAIAREEMNAGQGGTQSGSSASAESLRKLRVVASILAIRARGEGEGGQQGDDGEGEGRVPSAASALAHLGRRWSMRGSDVLRGLERVAASARLAAEIAARSESARGDTVGRMRAVLARTVGDAARRVAQGSESKSQRWRDEVCGAYASGEAALLREGQQLADAVTAGLELFVGTGMLIGPDGRAGGGEDDEGAAAEDDDEADVALVPVSSWRRARDMRADAFGFSAEGSREERAAGASAENAAAGARQLLRKTHALALEGFVAWVEYASAVLLTNAAGTVRASAALREALDPARRRFEELVRSQMGGGGK